MAGAVSNLMVRIGADFSQLQRSMQQAQEQAGKFQSSLEKSLKGVETALKMVGIGLGIGEVVSQIKEGTQSAMELEATTDNLNRSLGKSAQSFEEWARTTATSYGLSQNEAEKYGANFVRMISLFSNSTDDIKNKTQDLLKTSAIIANGTGRSLEDVMERIRSGMMGNTEAIEDLGVFVNQSMIENTQAFRQFANGKHWADLAYNTKQQIIYYAIMEQAARQYGTTLNDNVHLKLVQFTATLKNVQTALGNAFLPILNRVLPLLTMMANKVLQVLSIVAQFTQALFGKAVMGDATTGTNAQTAAINNQAGAVGNLADAHEKLEKAKGKKDSTKDEKKDTGFLSGFDEVHTIDKADKSSGSSNGSGDGAAGVGGVGGAGGGLAGLNPASANASTGALEKVSAKVQEFANKVKAFFAPIGAFFMKIWSVIADYFKEKVKQISEFWSEHGQHFITAMQKIWDFLQPIILYIAKFIWDSIKGAIDGIIKFFEGLIEFIGGIFTGHWKEAFDGLWKMVSGFIQAAWNIFNLIFIVEIGGMLKAFVEFGAKLFVDLAGFFKKPLGDFVTWMVKAFWDSINGIKDFFSNLGNWIGDIGGKIEVAFGYCFGAIARFGEICWNGIKAVFGGAYDWFMRTLVNPVVDAFDRIKDGFQQGFGSGLKAIANSVIDLLNDAISSLNSIIHLVPGAGGVSIPHIPHLYRGGITNGPTLAMIGDNAGGQEVVSPLDRLTGIVTNAVLTAMSYNNQTSNPSSGDIVLNIDGRAFAKIIKPYTDMENKRVGTNIRLQSI